MVARLHYGGHVEPAEKSDPGGLQNDTLETPGFSPVVLATIRCAT
jgi:hypothetical protein